jgi:acyl-CoA dehydrogenase
MFEFSPRSLELQARLKAFMDAHVYPNEAAYKAQQAELGDRWDSPPIMDELKARARAEGLWNLFLPESHEGAGLTNMEYAPLCEIMGRSYIGPEVFNCSAPDTGNMEVLERYGAEEHKERWLKPLLNGEIRSAFSMTEPAVASSDATNISLSAVRDGDHYVLNGRKWWTSGAGDNRTKILIVMAKTNPEGPRHQQHSMILVPKDSPGVRLVRSLKVFGYEHTPCGHFEIEYRHVRVPAKNLLLGEGRGFEIAQGRLGPGRIHHCMRMIGVAERAMDCMIARARQRVAFGKPLADQGMVREAIGLSRIEIDQARLLTLHAANMMDKVGNKAAQLEIAMIKVAVPKMLLKIVDDAIQAFGGAGVTEDPGLARMYAQSRTLRLVDGPDEVHNRSIARMEIARHGNFTPMKTH